MFGAGPTGIILAQLLRRRGRRPHGHRRSGTRTSSTSLKKYGFAEEDLVLIDKKDPAKHTTEIKAKMPKALTSSSMRPARPSITEATFNFVHGQQDRRLRVCPAGGHPPGQPYKIFSQEYIDRPLKKLRTHCFRAR